MYIWILIGNLRLSIKKQKKKHLGIPAINRMLQWRRHFIIFFNAITPAHGNCFQTCNQPEHESDDYTGSTHMCVTSEKDMVLQQQIWSTFVTVVWFINIKFSENFGIILQKYTWGSNNFRTIEIPGEKWYVRFVWHQCQWQRDVGYITTFHCTSVSQNFVGEEEWSIQFSCYLITCLNFSCF